VLHPRYKENYFKTAEWSEDWKATVKTIAQQRYIEFYKLNETEAQVVKEVRPQYYIGICGQLIDAQNPLEDRPA
jgi:hypothetical protein